MDEARNHLRSRVVFGLGLAALIVLSGCATRPDATVLLPVTAASKNNAKTVRIIAATNRKTDTSGVGFDDKWAVATSFEIYDISVPPKRQGTTIAYPEKKPDAERQYFVSDRKPASTSDVVNEVTHAHDFDGTVGVFVHGYNYSYQEALYRTAQMAADAKMTTAPILFSWPSAASYTGYVADKDATLFSRSELDELVTTLAHAHGVNHIVLFGHSMGALLTMEVVRQLKLEGRDDVVRKLAVVLAAPDIDFDVFRSQLMDIGPMSTPITLLVAKNDGALWASSLVAQERPRVGRLDINDPRIKAVAQKENINVIDITSVAATDGLGHDRFASLAKYKTQFASFGTGRGARPGEVGAYVFNATTAIAASPFRFAKNITSAAQ